MILSLLKLQKVPFEASKGHDINESGIDVFKNSDTTIFWGLCQNKK